jgi:diguanylate cyclase (GGDEF)-like protein/PAS domain S-box-containing protein
MYTLISSQDKYGELINLSGKQRMLSQKTAYYSHLVQKHDVNKQKLQELLELMRKDHNYIVKNLTSQNIKEYYLNDGGLDHSVREYFKYLENFLLDQSQKNLQQISSSTEPLLKSLNKAVEMFENESEMMIEKLEKRELFIYIGTLLTLILEAIFIIRPMISSNKKYLEKLEEEVELQTKDLQIFEQVFKNSSEGMIITDSDEKIININTAFTYITGYTRKEALGQTPRILKSHRHNRDFYRSMWNSIKTNGIWSGEIINSTKDATLIYENLTIIKMQHNSEVYYLSIFSDITEHVHNTKELDYMSTHDTLTGLLNRSEVLSQIDHAIKLSQKTQQSLALLFVDLDNFKIVNDSLGHSVGDQLLVECSKRFLKDVKDHDTIGRIGGDEFVVLLEALEKKGDEVEVVEKILESIKTPYIIEGEEIYIGASVGITYYPCSHESGDVCAQDLVKQADLAMYEAKELGKNQYAYYDEKLSKSVTSKHRVEQKLRDAIRLGTLELYMQPKVSVESSKIVGAEMLVRWIDDGVMIMPDEFIPIAEESNLIQDLDLWVTQESIKILKEFSDSGLGELKFAFNISGRSFRDEKIIDKVLTYIKDSKLERYLEVEVTEGVLVQNYALASEMVKKIKALGVSVALDDFGTGYSSFSYLSQISFDTIKIDRSFISTMNIPKQKVLVESMIWFSDKLGMSVVAEGVETQGELKWLKEKGCQYAQGYYFSKPIQKSEFKNLLQNQII